MDRWRDGWRVGTDVDPRTSECTDYNFNYSVYVIFQPTNFSNPMYDSLYSESNGDLGPLDSDKAEKRQLLKTQRTPPNFYDDDDERGSSSFT